MSICVRMIGVCGILAMIGVGCDGPPDVVTPTASTNVTAPTERAESDPTVAQSARVVAGGEAATTNEVNVAIGDVTIVVPVPDAYGEIPDELSDLSEFMNASESPKSQLLARFVLNQELESIADGQWPDNLHYANVVTPKRLSDIPMTPGLFSVMRNTMRQISVDKPKAKAIAERATTRFEEAYKSELDLNVEIAVNERQTFGPHIDRDDLITLSTITGMNCKKSTGEMVVRRVASAGATVLVRQRVVSLFVYGEPSELSNLEQRVAEWAEQLLTANASPAPAVNRE